MSEFTLTLTENPNASFRVTTGPVTGEQALAFADELETALGQIANGERKPGKIPVEPIARLIQYTRDTQLAKSKISEIGRKRMEAWQADGTLIDRVAGVLHEQEEEIAALKRRLGDKDDEPKE